MRHSVGLDTDENASVYIFLFFFFLLFFDPTPLALFMSHEQCIKANA